MCTPFQWTKQVASHWGGTRNGTIVHWPAGIKAKGEVRSQFTHVIDVAPTILEAAGIPEPTFVNGVQQSPIEGTSMVYSFEDKDAVERHDLQYFEMFGNRGIYNKGWSAVTRHSTPWLPKEKLPELDDDVWELYDGSSDFAQAEDLSEKDAGQAGRAAATLADRAVKYNVLPIDDRRVERLNATIAGRPQLITGTSQAPFPGMKRLSENSVVDVKNRSFSVTASLDAANNGPTSGVIIAQGGRFGGWALYAKDGKAKFVYNVLGMQEFIVEATEDIALGSPGPVRVHLRRRRPGQGRRRHDLLRREVPWAKVGWAPPIH
jgi:arylsulfatase